MAATPALDTSRLPPQLRRLVRALGLPLTLVLLKARGGTRLNLPRGASDVVFLAALLGTEGCAQLVQEFEGQPYLWLPKLDKLLLQRRDEAIAREHREGESLMTLALRYDLTTRHILNVLQAQNGLADGKEQLDLFGASPASASQGI